MNPGLLEMPAVATAREISPVAGDERMWVFLRECLRTCVKQHDACESAQDRNWSPKRLLRLVQPERQECYLQLVDTSVHKPTSRYVTVSHCWGTKRPLCTTSENVDSHRQRIGIGELPKTFQQCVVVAKELDIHYIWIDSLCILQDETSDWAQQAEIMDKIYENALFTIAVVSSRDSTVPFLGSDAPSERHRFQSVSLDADQLISPSSEIRARHYDTLLLSGFITGPLEYRAWAWQERQLSVRTINFTEQEVHWCCKSMLACECSGASDRVNKHGQDDTQSSLADEWQDAVFNYSRRSLAYATDRLPALSGYASRFQARLQSEYIAGLWLSDFPACLAWFRRELCDCNCSPGPTLRPSLDNAVPSWSWASAEGQVFWASDVENPYSSERNPVSRHNCVQLVNINCSPSTDNKFGEVQSGSYIELIGKEVEAEMETNIHGCASVRRKGFRPQLVIPDCHLTSERANEPNVLVRPTPEIDRGTSMPDQQVTLRRSVPKDGVQKPNPDKTKGTVSCLLLYFVEMQGKRSARILILSKKPGQNNLYQRLGAGGVQSAYASRKDWHIWKGWETLEEWQDWEEWFADAETRKLRII